MGLPKGLTSDGERERLLKLRAARHDELTAEGTLVLVDGDTTIAMKELEDVLSDDELKRFLELNSLEYDDRTTEDRDFYYPIKEKIRNAKAFSDDLAFLRGRLPEERVGELVKIGKMRTQVASACTFGSSALYHSSFLLFLGGHRLALIPLNACYAYGYSKIYHYYTNNRSYLRCSASEAKSILLEEQQKGNKDLDNASFWSPSGWEAFYGRNRDEYMANWPKWPHLRDNCVSEAHALEVARARDPLLFGVSQLPSLIVAWGLMPHSVKWSPRGAIAAASMCSLIAAGKYKVECSKGAKSWRIMKHAEEILSNDYSNKTGYKQHLRYPREFLPYLTWFNWGVYPGAGPHPDGLPFPE